VTIFNTYLFIYCRYVLRLSRVTFFCFYTFYGMYIDYEIPYLYKLPVFTCPNYQAFCGYYLGRYAPYGRFANRQPLTA